MKRFIVTNKIANNTFNGFLKKINSNQNLKLIDIMKPHLAMTDENKMKTFKYEFFLNDWHCTATLNSIEGTVKLNNEEVRYTLLEKKFSKLLTHSLHDNMYKSYGKKYFEFVNNSLTKDIVATLKKKEIEELEIIEIRNHYIEKQDLFSEIRTSILSQK